FDGKSAAERLEPGITEIGVLDARNSAARQESDACSAGGWWAKAAAEASGAREAVRGAAEVVYQCIVPVVREFSEHADPRAAGVHAIVETLRNSCRRVGSIVVPAHIEMQPAGEGNAVAIVCGAKGWPIARHREQGGIG